MYTFEDVNGVIKSWVEALKKRETRGRGFLALFLLLLLFVVVPLIPKLFESKTPTPTASSLPTPSPSTSSGSTTSPSIGTSALKGCAAVARARTDYNLSDGTHQREAWTLLEVALRNWPTDNPSVYNPQVERARLLWQQGEFGRAVEEFASAYPCQ